VSAHELWWWDRSIRLRSRGGNLSPLAFIELVQALYRRVRPEVTVTADKPTATTAQLPHISIRMLRRETGQDGKQAKVRVTYDDGTRVLGQRFHHIFRFYVHGETFAQTELEAQLLEHFLRDYRGWLLENGVQQFAFQGGGSDSLSIQGGQEVPTSYRDYEVVLEELKFDRNPPIKLVELITSGVLREHTEWFSLENCDPIADRQVLAFPPVWVTHVWQGDYLFVQGVDYVVEPWGIQWLSSRPVPYAVRYFHAPQQTLEIID
jgi:hypothetical protein